MWLSLCFTARDSTNLSDLPVSVCHQIWEDSSPVSLFFFLFLTVDSYWNSPYVCCLAWCCPTGIVLHFLQTCTFTPLFRLDSFYWSCFTFIDSFFYQLMSTSWAASKVSISVVVFYDFRISIGYFLLFLYLCWDSRFVDPFLSYFYLSLQTQFPSFFGYF